MNVPHGVVNDVLQQSYFLDLDLVISKKSIHEGKGLMSGTGIDNLINEGCWEVVFGTCPIEIAEVCANTDGTLFFYSWQQD